MTRLPRPCAHHGCPELTQGGRCPKHTRARERQRGTAASRGYDGPWRKMRKAYLRHVGWRCERCKARPFDTSKMHVHHKDGQATGPRRLDPTNLEALCQACHMSLHGSERATA